MSHMKSVAATVLTIFISGPASGEHIDVDAKMEDLIACMNSALKPGIFELRESRIKAVADATDVQRAAFKATGDACVKFLEQKAKR